MAKYIGGALKFMHGNPDGFGKYYVGSTAQKHNNLKRKKIARQFSK